MLLRDHKIILKNIIRRWENKNGELVKLENNDIMFVFLKRKLKADNDKLRTMIWHLELTGMISKSPYVDKKKEKYAPTQQGFESIKKWYKQEKYRNSLICDSLNLI